jgi:organic radical activating enzyme
MYGTNPLRPPEKGDGSALFVQDIFATLQGEGPYAGWPAVFIRLGGCNLACDFCDTEFERFRLMPIMEIRQRARELAGETCRLIVLTGGEPLRQPVAPLCATLIEHGFKIQIETNGTLFRPLPAEVEIVCSPKKTGAAYARLRPDLLARAQALKFIVSARRPDYAGVEEVGQGEYGIPVYVQPMVEGDEARNAENLAYAVRLARQEGYRLSVQLHKILDIP